MLIKGELRYIQILKDRGTCIDSRLDEIEETLKRGEKYEEMWRQLRKNTSWMATTAEMDRLEQKYFPKDCDNCIHKRVAEACKLVWG